MRIVSTISFVFALLLSASGFSQDIPAALSSSFQVTVSNPLPAIRENVLVVIGADAIRKQVKEFNPGAFVVLDNSKEIASQYNHQDPQHQGIVFVLPKLDEKETRKFTVRYAKKGELERTYPKRTQAELSHKVGGKFVNREYQGGTFQNVNYLRVPPEHKDHSWFIRYEGPGWESDKVGYRLYLDQRNATDVFGKKTTDMVLQQVGHDGFDSYHNMQPWGMDVMKVGKSLGLGSLGAWKDGSAVRVEKTDSVTCRISENGDVYSSITTDYYGWTIGKKKTTVQSVISIHAGTSLTRHEVAVTTGADSLCTGIVKDSNAKLFTSAGDKSGFGYLATYGKQSLNADGLGLAVFFAPQDAHGFVSDEFSHVIALRPSNGRLTYYFLASWVQEPGGLKNETEFLDYVKRVASMLGSPVRVSIDKPE